MALRLVFCEKSRGVPSLERGWRTPDPSPSRSAALCPAGAALKLCLAETDADAQTPRGRTQTWWPYGAAAAAGVVTPSEVERRPVSRTPSPSPIRGAASDAGDAEGNLNLGATSGDEEYDSTPSQTWMPKGLKEDASTPTLGSPCTTPRMRPSLEPTEDDAAPESECTTPRLPSWRELKAPRLVFCEKTRELKSLERGWRTPDPSPTHSAADLPAAYELCLEDLDADAEEGASVVPGETAPQPGEAIATQVTPPPPACYMPAACYRAAATAASADAADDAANADGEAPLFSAGSVGHPDCCAEPCKYAKKKRGCKDGAACNRCHLCPWKKPSAASKNKA